MCQEQPSIDNGEKKVLGIKVKSWVILFVFLILATIFIFAAIPFIISLILQAVYPGNDYSKVMGLSEGVTFIIGFLGTIASISSIFMTVVDRKRYNEETVLANEQRESVQKILSMTKDMSVILEQTSIENHRMAMAILGDKNKNPNVSVSTKDEVSTGEWNSVDESAEIRD